MDEWVGMCVCLRVCVCAIFFHFLAYKKRGGWMGSTKSACTPGSTKEDD